MGHTPHEFPQETELFDQISAQTESSLKKRGLIKQEPKSQKGKPK
jgi:hypothetical protein